MLENLSQTHIDYRARKEMYHTVYELMNNKINMRYLTYARLWSMASLSNPSTRQLSFLFLGSKNQVLNLCDKMETVKSTNKTQSEHSIQVHQKSLPSMNPTPVCSLIGFWNQITRIKHANTVQIQRIYKRRLISHTPVQQQSQLTTPSSEAPGKGKSFLIHRLRSSI